MPDAASRVKRTAEFELLRGDLVCKQPPRLSARAAATSVQGANVRERFERCPTIRLSIGLARVPITR